MSRVRVLGARGRLQETVGLIQDLGLLHLAPPPADGRLAAFELPPTIARRRRRLTGILNDIEVAQAGLGAVSGTPRSDHTPADLVRWARLARRVRREVERLARRAAALEEESALLARYAGFLGTFEALLRSQGSAPGMMAFHVVLRPDQADALPRLRAALEELLDGACETLVRPLRGGETALLLLVSASAAPAVERLLAESRVQEVPVPGGYGATLLEAIPRMRGRAAAAPRELAQVEAERAALRQAHAAELARARGALRDRLLQLDALPQSVTTTHAFVLEGWLPAALEPRLRKAVEESSGGSVVVETISREHWGGVEAPVVLRNPRLFRPFELITTMLPLPRYGSLDPTPFVAVFFPMFFGLMLGDAGYAAVLALLALGLRRRSRPGSNMRSLAEVAGACAAFALAFGVLFGECFGDLGHRWLGLTPLWMDRQEALIPFLGLSLAVGVVHILLGLVLGALSTWGSDRRHSAGRGVSAVMIALIALALLAAFEVLPRALLTPAAIALLVAFPALLMIEGVVAPIELLSTLGHILSYARIMALGTASVMLAIVANQLAGAMGSVVVGVLFALLFHLVNFALGLFSPAIHALRLHYVEFFGTCYSPGGVRYEPLGHWSPASAAAATPTRSLR